MGLFSSNNDIFRTQADNRFNSFSEPMNPVNMNPGNWGVNPNYLTPPYLSPFRPQYQGPTGPSYSSFRPSWGTSMNQVFNPFAPGGENYGGNYMQQTSPYYDSMFNKPMDGAASFAQNWAAPAAASWASYKYFGDAATSMGRSFGAGLGRGVMSGAGAGFRATSGVMRASRWMGGAAAGLFLPTLIAQTGIEALDSAVFDPYVGQRRTANSLRENFQGVSFGEGTGDPFNGGGISRRYAANIARQVSKAGAMDMTFNQKETSLLTDYASRSGLMDNVSSTQMSSRFESLLKQVKLVMSVANTSDFKETIEIMSKMQMAGVGSNQLAGVMGRMSAAASAGGQSFQKLFNTVGAQGQYMFGAQGLTPYVGMQSAFDASASMNAAFRSGLISPAMAARMGGVEGATQSAVAAQVGAYRTPYSTFQAYNAYMGKGETGDVVGNINRFGGAMASGNPLQNIGRFMMSQNALISRHIEDRGVFGEQQQIYQLAQKVPGAIGANGKVSDSAAYMIMTQMMGLSPDMAQAKLAQIASFGDDKTVSQMLAGNQRASIDSLSKYNQQEGLNKGILTSLYNPVKRGFMSVQKVGARGVGNFIEDVGEMSDSVQNFMNEALFGIKAGDNRSVDIRGSKDAKYYQANVQSAKFLNGTKYDTHYKDLDKLNALAKSGEGEAGKQARIVLDPGSSRAEKKNALDKLGSVGHLRGDYTKSEDANSLLARVDQLGVVQESSGDSGSVLDKVVKNLSQIGGGKTIDENLEYGNLMKSVSETLNNGKGADISDKTLSRISELSGKKVGDLDRQTLREMSSSTLTKMAKQRISHLLGVHDVGNAQGLEKVLINERGGVGLAPVINSSGDTGALTTQMEAQIGIMKQKSDINRNYKEGKIDFSTGMAAISALDNKETTGKFSDAVTDFVGAVAKFKGESGSGERKLSPNDPAVLRRLVEKVFPPGGRNQDNN